MAQWKKLESESDYEAAVDRVNIILDADRTDEIQNEIMLLSYLIEEYDTVHYPMPDAAPHEVIKFMLDMKDLKQKDLIPILGTKGNVSKILSGAAKLPLESLSPLSKFLGIPVEALIPAFNKHTDEEASYKGPIETEFKGSQVPELHHASLTKVALDPESEYRNKKKGKVKH